MRYELVIIWDTGEKEVTDYPTLEEAEERESGYHTAFGNQIAFSCVNQRRV